MKREVPEGSGTPPKGAKKEAKRATILTLGGPGWHSRGPVATVFDDSFLDPPKVNPTLSRSSVRSPRGRDLGQGI